MDMSDITYSKREKTKEEEEFKKVYKRYPDRFDLTSTPPELKRELRDFLKGYKQDKGFTKKHTE